MSTVGPDTTECSNCGTEIRINASVCHNCGEENVDRPGHSISVAHDPSQYDTTVSDSWFYGVAGGMGLWIIGFAVSQPVEALAGFVMLVAWITLPISAYFDMKYIRANSGWNPNTVIWVVGFAIPLLNIILGVSYLYRRHESIGTP